MTPADRGARTNPVPTGPAIERRAVDRRTTAQLHRAPEHGVARTASILVIDDHLLLAETVVRALREVGFIADFAEPCTPEQVHLQAEVAHPTLALLDLDLASVTFDGFTLLPDLRSLGCEVITLSNSPDRLLAGASFEAGAVAHIDKTRPFVELLDMVKMAARHRLRVGTAERTELVDELRRKRAEHQSRLAPFASLSPREREVLAGLLEGRSAETIAASSFVSITTVRSQIRAVLSKLHVRSQLEVVVAARRAGWSPEGPPPMARYSATLSL